MRWSLLSALGLVPLACGGVIERDGSGLGSSNGPRCTTTDDPSSTLIGCSEGYTHRTRSVRCGEGQVDTESRGRLRASSPIECASDPSVCELFRFSECATSGAVGYCTSGCAHDSDCEPGQRCQCNGGRFGACTYDACDSNADCQTDYYCAAAGVGEGIGYFRCQTPGDTCYSQADCDPTQSCFADDSGRYTCGIRSVAGGPFLVESDARVAAVVEGAAWRDLRLSALRLDSLSSAARGELAQHWTKLGQMEHASIAAFARFSLQLLSLGAPPELVEACTQALADETAHTKLCFGIASAYAGRAVGPGPLDVSDSLNVTSLVDIVDLVIAEGCFGETGAALEALNAAATAHDPVIVAAYTQIAADEQRHAELAFRFVRWALERDFDAVRERIAAALSSDFGRDHAGRSVTEPCLSTLVAVGQCRLIGSDIPAPRQGQAVPAPSPRA